MEDRSTTQTRVFASVLGTDGMSSSQSVIGGTPSWRSGASPSPTPPIGGVSPSTPLPQPDLSIVPRPLTERETTLVKHLSRLQFFLATAPTRWMGSDGGAVNPSAPHMQDQISSPHPNLNRHLLPNGEYVSCVYWNGLYHITGTDIVRALMFRFEAFSRPVRNTKKFEEGVFSDLRNLKPGQDACLEEPKSAFLDLLFRNCCIRTQKKQKVFYWFSVPHDRLFLDALERDLKREKLGQEPTTVVVGEPARSFRYDPKRSLFEQFAGKQSGQENVPPPPVAMMPFAAAASFQTIPAPMTAEAMAVKTEIVDFVAPPPMPESETFVPNAHQVDHGLIPAAQTEVGPASSVLVSKSLFEGSRAYKQRRKAASGHGKALRSRTVHSAAGQDEDEHESGSDEGNDSLEQMEGARTPLSARLPDTLEPSEGYPSEQLGTYPGIASSTMFRSQSGPPQMQTPAPVASSQDQWGQPFLHTDMNAHSSRIFAQTPLDPVAQAPDMGSSSQTNSASSTPTRGFGCPLLSCGRVFKRLEHLRRHVRTHTQERPYACNRCPKRFSRSDNLAQHIKTHEKADRGERLKTEMSESTEEDTGYLEAEVDAMSAGEAKGFGGSREAGPSLLANGVHRVPDVRSMAYMPGPFSTTPFAGYPPHQSDGAYASYAQGLSHASPWASAPRQAYMPAHDASHAQHADWMQRQRSMPPSVPSPYRASPGPSHQMRYHPYAPASIGNGHHSAYPAAHRPMSTAPMAQSAHDGTLLNGPPMQIPPGSYAAYPRSEMTEGNEHSHAQALNMVGTGEDTHAAKGEVPMNHIPSYGEWTPNVL